jgi:hypothetical protein
MWEDPIVEEIHRVREDLAATYDGDLKSLFRELREQQQRGGRTVISEAPKPVAEPTKKAS